MILIHKQLVPLFLPHESVVASDLLTVWQTSWALHFLLSGKVDVANNLHEMCGARKEVLAAICLIKLIFTWSAQFISVQYYASQKLNQIILNHFLNV